MNIITNIVMNIAIMVKMVKMAGMAGMAETVAEVHEDVWDRLVIRD